MAGGDVDLLRLGAVDHGGDRQQGVGVDRRGDRGRHLRRGGAGGDADADLLAADVEVQGPGAGDRAAEQDGAGGGGAGAEVGERDRPGLGEVVAGLQRQEHAMQHRAAAEIALRLRRVADDDRHAGGGGAGGELLAEDKDPARHAEQALNRAGVRDLDVLAGDQDRVRDLVERDRHRLLLLGGGFGARDLALGEPAVPEAIGVDEGAFGRQRQPIGAMTISPAAGRT